MSGGAGNAAAAEEEAAAPLTSGGGAGHAAAAKEEAAAPLTSGGGAGHAAAAKEEAAAPLMSGGGAGHAAAAEEEAAAPLMSGGGTGHAGAAEEEAAAPLMSDAGHAAAAEEEEGAVLLLPRWVEPRLRRLVGTRRHKQVDAVVSTNGGGKSGYRRRPHYATISEALDAAPPPSVRRRYVIYVLAGTYYEVVRITRNDVTLVGDEMGRTVIVGNRSKLTGDDMPNSAILRVNGSGFMARDLTIRNTAGVAAGPAVALMSSSDRSVYFRCEMDGYQDTLNADCNLQFYHSCRILGTVDFVFGYAKAVFQRCELLVRPPVMPGGHCVVTAQGRDAPDNQSGFVFQDSTVAALPGVNLTGVPTFLGRPWKNHSEVVFMNCLLDGIIDPAGWERWKVDSVPVRDTIYYGEFKNRGGGANTGRRVKWSGFHIIQDAAEAEKFTVHNFIQGDQWLPEFGVDYKPGL